MTMAAGRLTGRDGGVADELRRPSYWLVTGLDWPGGELAEAAHAIAPMLVPRDALSSDAVQVLGCADLYARSHGMRVVFFSDLTRMFAQAGRSWESMGVDWQRGLEILQNGPFPGLLLTVSERAYLLICDPSAQPAISSPGDPPDGERELARQAIERRLDADWPPYMDRLVAAGRVQPAG